MTQNGELFKTSWREMIHLLYIWIKISTLKPNWQEVQEATYETIQIILFLTFMIEKLILNKMKGLDIKSKKIPLLLKRDNIKI